jgi:hypothetical protein
MYAYTEDEQRIVAESLSARRRHLGDSIDYVADRAMIAQFTKDILTIETILYGMGYDVFGSPSAETADAS